jgi:hypothetical protein
MKLLEYEENLPKHYDKEKFVLSGLRYEAILNCLDKEKAHKTEEGAKFKPYKNNRHFIIDVYNILCCGGFLSHEHLFHISLFFI